MSAINTLTEVPFRSGRRGRVIQEREFFVPGNMINTEGIQRPIQLVVFFLTTS